MKLLSSLLVILFSSVSYSYYIEEGVPAHGWTAQESLAQAKHNQGVATQDYMEQFWPSIDAVPRVSRLPYSELDDAGYLIFSDPTVIAFGGDAMAAKKMMAKNLPAGVTLVVMSRSKSETHTKKIRNFFRGILKPDRLKVIYLPGGGNDFWARDGVPVPVLSLDAKPRFSVVDARYYYDFEQDEKISKHFGASLVKHNYYFEGGNFIVNSMGSCLIVENERVESMPESAFVDHYGCKQLIRFPHTKGIGHADESLKFMDDNTVLTDDDGYQKILEDNGFKAVRLPRPQNKYETYVNALTINGTLFLPVFDQPTDQEAIRTYESFGLKVVPLASTMLSNMGMGSIHCITMTYPQVPFRELVQHLGVLQ